MSFCLATGLAKGSILLFYLRIFAYKSVTYTVWDLFAFMLAYSIAYMLVNVFSCSPIAASWVLEEVATARCINRPVFYFAQAGLGIFTDIATVVMPLPLLRTLHLPMKQKIGVGVILTMGAFVCVVSGIRLQSLYTLLRDPDLTNNTVVALMWCVLELNLSIIGGCMPAAKPFIRKVFPALLGTSQKSGRTDDAYIHQSGRSDLCPDYLELHPRSKGRYSVQVSSRVREEDADSESHIVRCSNGIAGSGSSGLDQEQITKNVEFGYKVTDDEERGSQGRRDL